MVVSLSVAEDGSGTIAVEDDGPGIDPALREAVLQRGVRADEALPGSGLGLAIVRDLAELYGGSDRARRGARRRPHGTADVAARHRLAGARAVGHRPLRLREGRAQAVGEADVEQHPLRQLPANRLRRAG